MLIDVNKVTIITFAIVAFIIISDAVFGKIMGVSVLVSLSEKLLSLVRRKSGTQNKTKKKKE